MALNQKVWALLWWALLALALAIMPGTASAQVTCDPDAPLIQASIADAGAPRGEYALSPQSGETNILSADGRFLVFNTYYPDINTITSYLYDRETCTTSILIEYPLALVDWWSVPTISHDGRYIAFSTDKSDVVANDTNGKSDVFLRDLQMGTTVRISLSSTGQQLDIISHNAIISGDGRYVIYLSDWELTLYDRVSNSREPIRSNAYPNDISPDGRFIMYDSSDSSIVPNDTNNASDVFVLDRQSGVTERVSVASDGTQANSDSGGESISADGRYVAFSSIASNLAPGDTNSYLDIFLHDRQTGQTKCISVTSNGTAVSGFGPAMSDDGRYTVFSSSSNAFEPNKPTIFDEAYLYDLDTGAIIRMSRPVGGGWSDDTSYSASVSPDGRFVAFVSGATNLISGDDDTLCTYDPPFDPLLPCNDMYLARLSPLLVTSRSDTTDGVCNAAHCSLREAILAANASQQPAIIDFSIAGADVKIIQPTSALPTITVPLTINGASQPGYSGTPLIQLDGSLAGANTNGLTINSAGSNVNGMTITRFSGHGIVLSGDGFNSIRNNLIGTDANSATNLGNGGNGILVSSGSGNAITDNGIHNNAANGVAILSGTGHVIRANSISNNGGLGIDLGNNGVTANDLRDNDSGPNQQQNYPLLYNVAFDSNQLSISGVIKSNPNASLHIALFQSAFCDPSGHGEGSTLLGTVDVTANTLGEAIFTFQGPGQSVGVITATATDGNSNTSEFSACRAVGTSIDDPPDTPVRNLFTTSTPTLTWTAVRFAALYEIQVDDNEDFSSPEYANANIPSTQLQVMTSALADGLYYWRVRAINGSGLPGLWSAVDTFVVDVP